MNLHGVYSVPESFNIWCQNNIYWHTWDTPRPRHDWAASDCVGPPKLQNTWEPPQQDWTTLDYYCGLAPSPGMPGSVWTAIPGLTLTLEHLGHTTAWLSLFGLVPQSRFLAGYAWVTSDYLHRPAIWPGIPEMPPERLSLLELLLWNRPLDIYAWDGLNTGMGPPMGKPTCLLDLGLWLISGSNHLPQNLGLQRITVLAGWVTQETLTQTEDLTRLKSVVSLPLK